MRYIICKCIWSYRPLLHEEHSYIKNNKEHHRILHKLHVDSNFLTKKGLLRIKIESNKKLESNKTWLHVISLW